MKFFYSLKINASSRRAKEILCVSRNQGILVNQCSVRESWLNALEKHKIGKSAGYGPSK
jgi:hypothetical protein